MTGVTPTSDYRTLTDVQRKTWARGDFHEIARHNVVMAERLCPAVDLRAGERVLDVACGTGTAALVAARHYCQVTVIDFVPRLLERAAVRARAEGHDVELRVADAQELPFDDDRFDVVLSVYGVQFASDQRRAAQELLRVCGPGGRIGLASPVPHGWSGDLFALHRRHAPPSPGSASPLRWGTEEGLRDLLGSGTRTITSELVRTPQYYRSVEHAVAVFSTWFGPTLSALERVAPEQRDELPEAHEPWAAQRDEQVRDAPAVTGVGGGDRCGEVVAPDRHVHRVGCRAARGLGERLRHGVVEPVGERATDRDGLQRRVGQQAFSLAQGGEPREPAVSRADVALPAHFEVALGDVVGGAQRRIERLGVGQARQQRLQPALPAPAFEQQHGRGRQRVGRLRVAPRAAQGPVHVVERHAKTACELPVEAERIEAIPLPRGDRRIALFEPQRHAASDVPAQRQVGELVAKDDGRTAGRPDGQQHDRVGVRKCGPLTP